MNAEQPEPLPVGFGITLDPSAKKLRDGLWFGGSPPRVMRLTDAGRRAWHELQAGPVRSRPAGLLARRLTDAGLAHPVPPKRTDRADLTVLVPAYDRADDLDRCLAALGCDYPVVVVDDGSRDPAAIARVSAAHGARLVTRAVNGGPAAARNTGLESVRSEFVALVDSDCRPPAGWLEPLLAHFADPLVAAVAPRVTPDAHDTWCGRYTAASSSLDLGKHPARVAARGRVGYVPTAALVARHAALVDVAGAGEVFDAALRVGEDVDLVWRLDAAGWRVRYEPGVAVAHREPDTWTGLLTRRFRYGTSAAALARAHPDGFAPLVLHPWPTLAAAGVLTGRPTLAAAGFGAAVTSTARTLHRADVPTAGLVPAIGDAVQQTVLALGRYATQLAAPLLVVAAAAPGSPRRRLAAAALLLAAPLTAWAQRRPRLDPARYVLASIMDESAYGAGVIAGSARGRSARALRPVITWRPLRIDKSTDRRTDQRTRTVRRRSTHR